MWQNSILTLSYNKIWMNCWNIWYNIGSKTYLVWIRLAISLPYKQNKQTKINYQLLTLFTKHCTSLFIWIISVFSTPDFNYWIDLKLCPSDLGVPHQSWFCVYCFTDSDEYIFLNEGNELNSKLFTLQISRFRNPSLFPVTHIFLVA